MTKKKSKIASFLFSSVLFSACTSLGSDPNEEDSKDFYNSTNFNKEKGVFENRRPDILDKMRENSLNWASIKEWLFGEGDRVPLEKLPEEKPDIQKFLEPSEDIKTVWFGHSTFLLNVDGNIILVDPVFSGAASPVSFMIKRFQDPVLALEELPQIEYIVISHDHYDHLDMESVKYFADKDVKFLTPLGVGSHLVSWGIPEKNIIEKDWWQTEKFGELEFVATPAQHFSGRSGINGNKTLWASWVIKTPQHRIYFSGDSGYDTHFKDIGERFGPFDIAFLESGQYNEKWREVHMLPDEAVQAYHDLKAKKYFPIHWGMFELSTHTWYEPIEKMFGFSQEKKIDLVAPKIGQLVHINDQTKLERWWDQVKKETITAFDRSIQNVTELYARK